jgi:hypothetical protein
MPMTMSRLFYLSTVAIAASTLALGTPAINAQTAGQPVRLSAWAVSMSNVATGANGVLDIRIDKWSTDKEREQLIATFLDKGQDGLPEGPSKSPGEGAHPDSRSAGARSDADAPGVGSAIHDGVAR